MSVETLAERLNGGVIWHPGDNVVNLDATEDLMAEAALAITTLSEKLAAAENDAAAWKADAGETHLKLAAAEADRELDAVLALVEAKLPGRRIMIWQCEDGTWAAHLINQTDTEYAPTPALAVAATLLQALEDKP